MWYSGTSEKNRRYIGLYRVEDVTGYSGGECHLIMSGKTVVLRDTGYDFGADRALEKIKAVLGGRRIDYILLTHSHYDHATGTGKIKRQYPGARVVASRYAAEIFKREGARRVMKELNEVAAKRAGVYGNADAIDELDADIMVQDGDVLRLNDMTVRVVGSPGHTKCSVCYFFEEERLLVACETLGIAPTYPVLQPCYVIGYKMTRDSIEAARKLDPKHVFIAHYGLIPDGDVCTYFDRAAEAAKRVKDIVLESYGEGMDRDGILDLLTEKVLHKRGRGDTAAGGFLHKLRRAHRAYACRLRLRAGRDGLTASGAAYRAETKEQNGGPQEIRPCFFYFGACRHNGHLLHPIHFLSQI
jgi:glyoxylase-like metal-dependent hydrolase (beta-lactamase superfamily II)